MKKQLPLKNLLLIFTLSFSGYAAAHCPAKFIEEKACFMLAQNMLYIWDQKFEHNGPYKDLQKATLTALKSVDGKDLAFKKIARGIYKLQTNDVQNSVTVILASGKKKTEIKVKNE